jgi:intracellular septation protein
VVNEVVWRNTSTDFWIGFKMWGAIPATLLFALANVPDADAAWAEQR